MPEQGWKTVTIPEQVYDKLMKIAERNSRSVAKQIEYYMKNCGGNGSNE